MSMLLGFVCLQTDALTSVDTFGTFTGLIRRFVHIVSG